jgi:leucyl-tRNA synthetase
VDWSEQTDSVIDGCGRYLDRVWRLAVPSAGDGEDDDRGPVVVPDRHIGQVTPEDLAIRQATHRLIDRVSRDYERWSYNTAVAACMEFVNRLAPYARGDAHEEVLAEAVDTLLLLLAPMTPHVAAEAWERRHGDHIHLRPWPVSDAALAAEETVTLVVQVNGKVRDRLEVAPGIGEEEATQLALGSEKVAEALAGAEPRRIISRPPKLVNIVA